MRPHVHSESELASFENQWEVSLPKNYRNYLMSVGGGCFTSSKLDLLEDWSYHADELPKNYLQKPFPHAQAWNDRTLLTGEGWNSPYFSDDWVAGSIRIRQTGCEGRDILIISGLLRGEVWHDDRACNGKGIFPLIDDDGCHLQFDDYIEHNPQNQRS